MTDYTIPRANAPIAGQEAPTIQWYNYLRGIGSSSTASNTALLADITIISDKLGSPDGTPENIPTLSNITDIQGIGSVFVTGANIKQVSLVNDAQVASPISLYGTNSSGAKGWHLVADAFSNSANISKTVTAGIVSFDLTDLADSGAGTLLATTFDAKGRKTGSRAATLTTASTSRITIANPDASAGLPTFDLATVADAGGGTLLGITRDSWGRVSGTHAITVTGTTNQVGVTGGTGSGAAIILSTPQDIATSSTPTFAQVALAADPTTALQAATKQYVDSVAAGLSPKAPALLATTANDSLSGLAARDGFTPSSGSRVLVKNQTLPAQNGIYIASAAAWTRATDMAAWSQVPSAYLWVEEGTINADTGWVCTSDPGGVIGVTAITFVQFGGNGTVAAGAGITVAGNQVSLGTPSTVTGATTNTATGTTHTHALTLAKSDVGLGNVDNTSDVNKPVSTAQAASLATKEPSIGAGTTAQFWRGDKTWSQVLQGNLQIAGASGFGGGIPGNSALFVGVNAAGINGAATFSVYTGSGSSFDFIKFSDGATPAHAVIMNQRNNAPVSFYTNNTERLSIDGSGVVTPGADNSQTLGSASRRWSVVYAGTGAINTSDAREKTYVVPLSDPELAAASEIARAIGTYQWLASVAEKGADNARHHAGLTVQRAIEIMQSHGLDPFRYGFICYDQWDETPEVVNSWPAQDAVLDDDGNVITPAIEAGSEVTQAYRPAGDRYSFRHDELLLFIARGFDARLSALEAKS